MANLKITHVSSELATRGHGQPKNLASK